MVSPSMIDVGVEEFEFDLARFARVVDVTLEIALRKTVFDLFNKIVRKSPVDSGAFRASHKIGINTIVEGEEPGGKPAKGNKGTISANKATADELAARQTTRLAQVRPYDTVYVSNSLPYAVIIEYGGYSKGPRTTTKGFSKQAPRGVYRKSLEEIAVEMNKTLESVGRLVFRGKPVKF